MISYENVKKYLALIEDVDPYGYRDVSESDSMTEDIDTISLNLHKNDENSNKILDMILRDLKSIFENDENDVGQISAAKDLYEVITDSLDTKTFDSNSTRNPAIYEMIEDGKSNIAYSHWGANMATGPIRYAESIIIAEKNNLSISEVLMNINYNGQYAPTEHNCDKVFNHISNNNYFGDINTIVTIDMDNDIFIYQENRKDKIILPLGKVVEITQAKMLDWNINKSDWDIYNFADELEMEFNKIKNNYNYTMDIVVVEPGMAAEHKQLDISRGKLTAMQKVVGGLIEPIYSISEYGMIVFGNEEAIIMNLDANRRIPGEQVVFGTFFICGDKDGEACSLTPHQVQRYVEKYKTPEILSDMEISKAQDFQVKIVPFPEGNEGLYFSGRSNGRR